MDGERGFSRVYDDQGQHVWNVIEYNGTLYSPFLDRFADRMDELRADFPVCDSDIFLLSYVKSGTHWLWEILMMLTRESTDIRQENKEEAMLEMMNQDILDSLEKPRVINTHLACKDVPQSWFTNNKCKLIQIHRNPKDVAVSYYHHLVKEISGSALSYCWDDYIDKLYFDEERMVGQTWFTYTRSWWQYKDRPNYFPVFYEDLIEDSFREIKRIAEFLGLSASDAFLQEVAANTSFEKMSKSKAELEKTVVDQYFQPGYSMYRKGIVGDWKNHFSETQNKRHDRIFEEQMINYPELKDKIRFLL